MAVHGMLLNKNMTTGTSLLSRWWKQPRAGLWVQILSEGITPQVNHLPKRCFDFSVALVACLLLSPLFVLVAILRGREGFERIERVGWCGVPFTEMRFAPIQGRLGAVCKLLGIYRLPCLWNILRGEMSLVGPRAVSPGEINLHAFEVWQRQSLRPGLICLWWVRKRMNIGFEGELQADIEYLAQCTVKRDLGIAARALPALLFGGEAKAPQEKVSFLGIPVHNLTMSDVIEKILDFTETEGQKQISFVNADCYNIAQRDSEYKRILQSSELTLADGIGVKLAGKLLGRLIRQNVNGTDLFPRLCQALEGTGKRLFLLGARPEVAEGVRAWVAERYPSVNIVGVQHSYYDKSAEGEVIHSIRESEADILLVAFGAPHQERWIAEHLTETGAKVALGVGGLFDFYSGRISRAPQWMREIGMEWFYRFLQEPRRMWRRYFVGNFVFLYHILMARLRGVE